MAAGIKVVRVLPYVYSLGGIGGEMMINPANLIELGYLPQTAAGCDTQCASCGAVADDIYQQLCGKLMSDTPTNWQGLLDRLVQVIQDTVPLLEICDDRSPGGGTPQNCADHIFQVILDFML